MIAELTNYKETVFSLLDKLGCGEVFAEQQKIILKPNLVGPFEPPITTDLKLIEALIEYIQSYTYAKIVVAEGSGECETPKSFEKLGYDKLPRKYGIDLVDLDSLPVVKLANGAALLYKEIYLPEDILDGFLVSVPVLKDHTLTKVSLGIKNLIGILPASKYSGFWSYRKSEVHRHDCDKAIVDINLYRPIDLVVTDGAIGQTGGHLSSGVICDPPQNRLIASFDPLEADIEGAGLLGHDWKTIRHLQLYSEHNSVI